MKKMMGALLAAALLLSMVVGASAAARVTFPVKGGMMLVGSSLTLKPKLSGLTMFDLAWASSDENVLKTSGNTVTALKPGLAVLSATGGGSTALCGVVVLPASIEIPVGGSYEVPRGGVERYRMKDENIATVSASGTVKGVAAGETLLGVKLGRQIVTLGVKVTGATGAIGATDATDATGAANAAEATDAARADSIPGLGDEVTQAVLVKYTGGSSARLSIHEKKDGVWTELFDCDAYVGKNGVGKTVEGDKKTPLGVYNLTTPFGIKEDPGANMPYTQVTQYHYWCGASDSGYYNQLIDERVVDRKHTSADEYLINYKGVYNYCMFIDYNAQGEAHKGSCIFLHCTGSNKYTGGCVAVPESVMAKIIRWAKPGVKIVIAE